MRVSVSVVLTVLNEAASIRQVLEDLQAQDCPADEVVVVDGGSTDGTQERVRSFPGVRLIEARGTNISQGRNRAIEAAQHDLIAVLDAGVRLNPDWLRHITAPLRDRRADVVAGFFEADPQTPFEMALGATTLPSAGEIDPTTFLPSSRSVAFTREAWRRAGGYPEWLDYCEDLVFDLRLRADPAIGVSFESRATVRFRPRPNLRAFMRQYYRYARGDGKANLWPRRHAARYAAYAHLLAVMACWAWPSARRQRSWLRTLTILTALGGAWYIAKPVRRLAASWGCARWPEQLGMLALVPVLRVAGDVAKMGGYPVGWLWRLRNRPPGWRP
ncbi:MAG: glycosyltransferase [Chloroflexi bacterium]|nr:glycosyltransferase [Chloroflexota bacterium]